MKKLLNKVKRKTLALYHRVQRLPKGIKYSLGILLIVIGAVNIVNPFVNGIFLILLGLGLLSENIYEKWKKKHTTKKDIPHKGIS